MNGRKHLAWNLRRIRVSRGLSQEKLAVDAGIDRAYLGGIERQTENPSLELLDRLADTLQVELSALVEKPAPGTKEPLPLRAGRRPKAD